MSMGFLLRLTVDNTAVQFQNVTVRAVADELDTSSSLNGDGSYNAGFSDVVGDLKTIFFEIDTVIKDTNVLALMAAFKPGSSYDVLYSAVYGTRTYSGRYIYVQHHDINASIPGAGRLRMGFRSTQGGASTPGGYAIT